MSTTLMMGDSNEHENLVGQPIKADGWYGNTDGLHTVVMQVFNFSGHIFIEATLELEPTEADWFPIQLTETTPYVSFPRNPLQPTGEYSSGGDTGSFGATFTVNAVWLRARLDRTYLGLVPNADDEQTSLHGRIGKITLAR